MLDPSLLTRQDVFVAKRTPISHHWSFGRDALLNFGVIVIFLQRNCLFAFWTTFEILVVLAFSQKMVIEIAGLYCLAAFRAESDHLAC
jgi:hypothetical protein